MKKKLIVFDLDGVVFDSHQLIAEALLFHYPTMTVSTISKILSGNFHEGMEEFKKTNQPVFKTKEEEDAHIKTFSVKKASSPLFEGMQEFLKKLHSDGYILAINTSAGNENSLPLLERAGISSLFQMVATSDISPSKEKKLKMIQEKFDATPKEILFVTDTIGDIVEASKAGVPTVAVTWGVHNRDDFTKEPHSNLIGIANSIDELDAYVRA